MKSRILVGPYRDEPEMLDDHALIRFVVQPESPASLGSYIDVQLEKDRRGRYTVKVRAEGGFLTIVPTSAGSIRLGTKPNW